MEVDALFVDDDATLDVVDGDAVVVDDCRAVFLRLNFGHVGADGVGDVLADGVDDFVADVVDNLFASRFNVGVVDVIADGLVDHAAVSFDYHVWDILTNLVEINSVLKFSAYLIYLNKLAALECLHLFKKYSNNT